MPDGYRRPLPSPYGGAGAGLGSLLAAFLTRPLRERGKREEDIRDAYEQAMLTGKPAALVKLREQFPKAVARFERERGLELPSYIEPPEMPEQIPVGMPEVTAAPPVGPGAPPMGGPPGTMPPAVVGPPPGAEATEMPWPTAPGGMQVRGAFEQMAGRPVPPFMKPEPSDITAQAVRTVMALPEDQRQQTWDALRGRYPDLPEMTFKITEPEPVTPREVAGFEAMWGGTATESERALFHERRMVPKRAPDEPEPDMPRALSVAEFASVFQATPDQILDYQFTGKRPARLKLRTEAAEPNLALMKWASAIAERTRGARERAELPPENTWDVAKGIMTGIYDFSLYQDALAVDERVQELKMMLIQARGAKNDAMSKQLSQQMAELLKITWKSGSAFEEFLLNLITPQYGQTTPQPGAAPKGKFDQAIEGWEKK